MFVTFEQRTELQGLSHLFKRQGFKALSNVRPFGCVNLRMHVCSMLKQQLYCVLCKRLKRVI